MNSIREREKALAEALEAEKQRVQEGTQTAEQARADAAAEVKRREEYAKEAAALKAQLERQCVDPAWACVQKELG